MVDARSYCINGYRQNRNSEVERVSGGGASSIPTFSSSPSAPDQEV